jgi:RNA polymerase sigma factor (sigma-70 family)
LSRQAKRQVEPLESIHKTPQQVVLHRAMEESWQSLLRTVQIYVVKHCHKLGITLDRALLETIAKDILGKTFETALTKADEFDVTRSPEAWFLGIAAKKVLEWGNRELKQRTRVVSIADHPQVRRQMQQENSSSLSQDEMFDLLHEATTQCRMHQNYAGFQELLELVQGEDRRILKLFYEDGLQGKDLAAAMGTTVGNIHVKLCRARKKLQAALEQEQHEGGN